MNNLSNSHTFLPEKCPCSDVTSEQGQIIHIFSNQEESIENLAEVVRIGCLNEVRVELCALLLLHLIHVTTILSQSLFHPGSKFWEHVC